MIEKVKKTINEYGMLSGVREVTVAVSGGADSVALLHIMYRIKDEYNIKLSAAHFNHMIRGEEADRDADFVKKLCERLEIPLFSGCQNVPEYAEKEHLSTELAARNLRYAFLFSNAPDVIATAHTASDNLETVIFNLSRGTALTGLCGIPAMRERIIRPLINCSRAEIENYCAENGLSFVTDSTNLCDDYSRNRIRHKVVPLLKELNPSIESAVSRMTGALNEDSGLLDSLADREFQKRFSNCELNIKDFDLGCVAIAKRVLIRYYKAVFGNSPDAFHTEEMLSVCKDGGRSSMPEGKTAFVKNGMFKISELKETFCSDTVYCVELEENSKNFFEKTIKINNLFLKNALDCDKINGQLVIRSRESGDFIRLKNRNGTKTLKKLYTEYSIPLSERDKLPVIADEDGVVWIYGIGVADRCAVNKNSDKIIKIKTTVKFLGDDI